MKDKKLQTQSPRWYCRYEALKAVKELYPALLLALENIVNDERSAYSNADAKGLLEYFNKLECLVMIELWTNFERSTKFRFTHFCS